MPDPASARLRSLDVVRGLTIFLMMFVNDLAGVQGVPGWLKHVQPPDADGMTFVDVVFPAFLFIVGMAIPLAMSRRSSSASTWGHVLLRTCGLLVIGVFMVNTETMSDAGPLSRPVWSLLMYMCVIAIWLDIPRHAMFVKGIGAVGLLTLAFLYRGNDVDSLVQLRPQWWGILGLIGWAFLVASSVYLVVRDRVAPLLGAATLLYLLYVASAAGAFSAFNEVIPWIDLGGALGSQAAIAVSGVVLGVVVRRASKAGDLRAAVRGAALYGLGLMLAAGLLHSAASLHPMFTYNKIAATPPWCLLSSAFTVWTWAIVAWLTDVRMHRRACGWLALAGQNALLAYILAPILYLLMELGFAVFGASNLFGTLGQNFVSGLIRSLLFAAFVTWLASWLFARQVRLRL